MSPSLSITQVLAVYKPIPSLLVPKVFYVKSDSSLVGYTIGSGTAQSIAPMAISDGSVPSALLRAFTSSGTFTIYYDGSNGIFVAHDQGNQGTKLLGPSTGTQKFLLTIDDTQSGVAAFSLISAT